ncbi:MAG: DUF1289 domain-containing protein [Limnohabitans sp.]|nr:DUF1289 domain-containing protein [Limnohabitans sp.]
MARWPSCYSLRVIRCLKVPLCCVYRLAEMSHPDTPWQSLRQRWQQVRRAPQGETLVSPCVSVCIMKTDADECHGCLRSIDEIARWGMATPAWQRAVWLRLGQRIEQHFK